MYLLKYRCPDCGTIFYAEEKEGLMDYCPFCACRGLIEELVLIKAELVKEE